VILDLKTIFVTGAVTCLVMAMMQLLAFATGRFTHWPVWWGLSSLAIGLGLLGGALRGTIPNVLSIELANTLLVGGSMLAVLGVRSFAGREMPWLACAMVLAVTWTLLALLPGSEGFAARTAIMAFVMVACDLAAIREAARLAQRENLRSAWILVGLFVPTAMFFMLRGALAVRDSVGTVMFPPDPGIQGWGSVIAIAFFVLRSSALLLMPAERSNNLLAALAQRDPLTGAMNRSGLEQAVARMATKSAGMSARVSLLLLDIDHFKLLNDTLGHGAGDEVLRVLSRTVHSQIRASDILTRQGGDEFAVVLPEIGAREAVRIADRIRIAFDAAMSNLEGAPRPPTLSIGIAEGDLASHPFDELLSRADEALYRSKRLGRNRVQAQLVPDDLVL
jgi:diguanylate cyclase (GGDEF)-like protein